MTDPNAKPKYFKVFGSLQRIMSDRPLYYLSCPECKKKVMEDRDVVKCENCNKVFNEPNCSYNFTVRISDSLTGTLYATVLGDESGSEIMGMPAKDLRQIREAEGVP